ncbi:histidine phosphatase family protein [Streptomyces sp. NPDC052023]|uniref:histidine phosphatase family protein n=1 Tax=Streptomyces sp. NPDC052023 TaxID=3365681 RepID=UPI0037D123F7
MVTVRVTMLCMTGADGSDGPVFGDGALNDCGRWDVDARVTETLLPAYSLALRAPSTPCARAAEALAITARPESALRDLDYGSWYGRRHEDVVAEDPLGFSAWLTDPDAAPHGGESVAGLCRRTAGWLSSLPTGTGRILAITEAAVVRAALVHALSAPARAFWHLGVPPLSAVTLTLRDGCWNARPGRMAIPHQQQPADHSTSVAAPATRASGRYPALLVRP